MLAEAIAVREALSWLKEHDFSDVIVFSDCQSLVLNLHHKVIARSDANRVAHALAKAEGAVTTRSIWRDSPPLFLNLLMS
nr:uncharacterized protein LOC109185260 [Ipomoea batatas]